jgi:cellulose synthase/poly-beta-1,6-N-acetylglucosamine synthase-like glycosyltransferase
MSQQRRPVLEPVDKGPLDPPENSLFPGGQLPRPESTSRLRSIQLVALIALAVSCAYLVWRVGFTLGDNLWLSIPLWILELHAAAGLALFAFSLWDLDAQSVPQPEEQTDLRIGVLIPTYNEPAEVLFPTVAAAVALQPEHETYVLDDGQRPWVRTMASSLGARYITREDRSHAKAGNLNHALAQLDLDLIAVLDADHVAEVGFLTHTLGYFHDPRIAVVQTPQDFYNLDSFEHGHNRSLFSAQRRSISFNEQRLFYRAIQPGKNRWKGAFWCGTNAVARVSALHEVGGIAHESVTEDMHTTIRLHRKGWETVYHNEVLAHGLAARNATEYQTQRTRWGTGAMQILHLEHPITGKGLSLGQRLAYASTILGWFDAWRTLGYVVLPPAVLFSGAIPIKAPLLTFAIAFGVTFVMQRLAMALLSRGYAPQGMAALFEFIRLDSNIRATLTFFHRGERAFKVTSKRGGDARLRHRAPSLLWLLVGLSCASLAWFTATLVGVTPTEYPVVWTAYGAAGWGLLNLGFVVTAIARIRSDKFSSERRTAARLQATGPASISGNSGQLMDISMGGAMVRCEFPSEPRKGPLRIEFQRGGEEIVLLGLERGRQTLADGSALIRLQFTENQERELARMALSLFSSPEPALAPLSVPTPIAA